MLGLGQKATGEKQMTKHYPVIIEQDEDGVFIVECPLFDGCRSYGRTIDEAMTNIREAIEVCEESADSQEPFTTFVGVRDIELSMP
jgi:predicted RNase H-like HicB family nuclease